MHNVKIKEICSLIFSGGTPSTSNKEFWNGRLNWLSSGETRNLFIKSTEKHISDEAVKKSSTKLSIPGDILIASAGQGYTRGQTSYNCINTYINQSLICLRPNFRIVNNKYLFYLLHSKYEELRQLSDSNSIRGSITTKLIGDYEISIPNLVEQQHIVDTIGSIDDLIEKLKEQNAILEKSINSTFTSNYSKWTINKTIGETFKCLLGGTPSTTKPEYWDGDINWINSGEINNFRIVKPSKKITELGMNKSATKLLPIHTTVIAITGATLGQVSLLEIPSCANQSVIGILENEEYGCDYIYPLFINIIDKLIMNQTGGAQQHINKNDVENFIINLPDKDEYMKYSNMTRPLIELQSINEKKLLKLNVIKSAYLKKFFG